jgi:hypothetical protein
MPDDEAWYRLPLDVRLEHCVAVGCQAPKYGLFPGVPVATGVGVLTCGVDVQGDLPTLSTSSGAGFAQASGS